MSYRDEVVSLLCNHWEYTANQAAEIGARADARIAELERECLQWRDELRIYRETENARIAELEQAVTVRDTEIARLETDLELARRDGGRYRFLKSQAPSVPGECRRRVAAHVHDWARSLDPAAQFDMWAYEELSGDRLDVEIDAARAGNGGEV